MQKNNHSTLKQITIIKYSYIISLFGNAIVILYAYLLNSSGISFWQEGTRFTARVSFLIFTILVISRMKHMVNFKSENNLFISFAISHYIHLFFLLYFNSLKGGLNFDLRVYFGMTAYVLLTITPILGIFNTLTQKGTELLRSATVLILWLVLFRTYFTRVMKINKTAGGRMEEFYIGFIIVILLGLWQVLILINKFRLKRKLNRCSLP